MQRGIYISGTVHLLLILIALFGVDFFQSDEALAIQMSEVDLVSADEFDAAISDAPDAPQTELASIEPPSESASDVTAPEETERPRPRVADTPDADAAEAAPDVSGLRVTAPTAARTEAPKQPDQQAVEVEGASLMVPEEIGRQTKEQPNRKPLATTLDRPAPPAPAPNISSKPAPKPPADAKPSEDAKPEVAPEPSPEVAEKPVEKPPEAPEEAASEIVPEVAETPKEPESVAPLAASRPRGRPEKPVEAPKPEVKPAPEAVETTSAEAAGDPKPEAKPAEKPVAKPASPPQDAKPARTAEKPKPASTPRAGIGKQFSASEKRGIGLAVGKNWNLATLTGGDARKALVVTIDVTLTRDGKVVEIRPYDPANPTGDLLRAFQTAKRAVLITEKNLGGIPVPKDKFNDGDILRLRFDPSKGAIQFI